MPELTLKLGDSVIERYVFDKDVVSLGRSRDNDIVVENLAVSRNHARVKRQGGKFVLTDLNSANGTYVNGVRISKTEIVDGDVIILGKHTLEFKNMATADDDMIVESLGADRTIVVDRAPIGYLVVTEGRLKGKEFSLTKLETTIGKGPNNDIVISDDWFLSKKQAVVVLKAGSYELQDMGGFRKTRLNGGAVSGTTILRPGNVVEFGNTRCVFELRQPASHSRPDGGRMPREIAADDSIFSGDVVYREHEPINEMEDSRPQMAPAAAATPAGINPEDVLLQSVDGLEISNAPTRDSTVTPQPAEPPATTGAAPVTEDSSISAPQQGRQKGRKKRKGPDTRGDYHTVEFSRGDEQERESTAEPGDSEPVIPVAAEPDSQEPPTLQEIPELVSAAAFSAPARTALTGDELAREVAIWEKALNNKSPLIRKQAAQRLKALTGNDYAT